MDDPDKPTLKPWEAEELALALHVIDETHWANLSKLLVRVETFANLGIMHGESVPKPVPPKQPLHLNSALSDYAIRLFTVEAEEYPNDPQLEHWLVNLTERVTERVIRSVRAIESAARPWKTLAHHGLTEAQMRAIVENTLTQQMEKSLHETRAQQQPENEMPSLPSVAEKRPIVPISSSPSTKDQLKELIDEAKLTIEQVAAELDVNLRTVYRHLAGETVPRKQHVVAYEKMFSKRLGRDVHLKVSWKRQ